MFKQAVSAIALLLGLNTAAAAQTPACATPKVAGDVVDLKQVPGTSLMTVPVEINGTPKQFLLDIGTNPDEVAQTTVADLHLPRFDQNIPSDAFAGQNARAQMNAAVIDVKSARAESGVTNQDLVRVGSLSIAGASVPNLQLPVANDRDMGHSEPYDGVFTGNLFAQYDINFDFGGKKFSFLDPTSCTDPNQVAYWPHAVVAVVPMTISNGKISVPVTIGGHAINAILDMGSDHTVVRHAVAEDTLGLGDKDMTPDGDREDGMGMRIYVHTFPQISFGGVTAENVPVRIQANSMVHPIHSTPVLGSRATFAVNPGGRIPDLALGMDVLHQLHIYAAYGENKLYVTPAE